MKKYIKRRYPLKPIHSSENIYCGVSVNGKRVDFDFNQDDEKKDIITLVTDSSGEYDDDNVTYVYGYSYTSYASRDDITFFRDLLKGKITPRIYANPDIEEFITQGIRALNVYTDISEFGAIINLDTGTKPSVLNMIRVHLMEYLDQRSIQFTLVKQAYENVRFDVEKAKAAMRKSNRKYSESEIDRDIEFTLNKFEELKRSKDLFQIKRFLPVEIRAGFMNFFKFASEEERAVFEQLQGVNVLIYDDFLTSGSTVKEVIRYLRAINDRNALTVFVLVKQH